MEQIYCALLRLDVRDKFDRVEISHLLNSLSCQILHIRLKILFQRVYDSPQVVEQYYVTLGQLINAKTLPDEESCS